MTVSIETTTPHGLHIDGEWRQSSSGETIEVRNMSDGSLLGKVPAGTPDDAQRALDAAQRGAKKWAATPAYRRVEILMAAVALIRQRKDELVQLLSAENGKTVADAVVEIDTTARIFEGFAQESLRTFGQTIPLDIQQGFEKDLMLTVREPLGVIVGIVPFNFPAELYAHKVGAALAAGNAIVVKPPEDDPLVSVQLTEILHEAGVPGDVLQIVTGYGEVVGDYLSRSPDIAAVSFTGSSRVGAIIAANAGSNIVRVFLELSGNDAFIVCEDADVDFAVDQAIAGRIYTNGQVCAATKRIMVDQSRYNEFVDKLSAKVSKLSVGDQMAEGTDVGPLVSLEAARRVEQQVAAAIGEGAVVRVGGARQDAYFEPTVLEISKENAIATDEEIFGPVFSILKFDNVDEAIEITNASKFGLNAGIFTTNLPVAIDAAVRIQAGTVSVNGGNAYRPDVAAFGGYKKSGIGREGTGYTLEEFTQIKSIVLRGVLPY